MAELCVKSVTINADSAGIVRDASFELRSGDFTALLGPNGAGKTSLAKAALGLIAPVNGQVLLDEKSVPSLTHEQRARSMAYLAQDRSLAWPQRVRDVVALGRYCYGASPRNAASADLNAVERAISACGLTELADRRSDTLSGGEQARMHCARALCVEAPILIADEPTAALDPQHAIQLMDILHNYARTGGAVLVILHDLALAARYASKLIWMKSGQIVATGTTDDCLDEALCRDVYGIDCSISGRNVVIEGLSATSSILNNGGSEDIR